MKMRSNSVRLGSVDVFRALTMLFMLFVNDCPHMSGIPDWMRHAKTDEDMLGFSDTVFPAFLFCVGMSVVLSLDYRVSKGTDWRELLSHGFFRTVALVVMGLFSMNVQPIWGLPRQAFILLMVLGFFLLWNVYRKGRIWMRLGGISLLVAMVVCCDFWGTPFQVKWWGILGLIGWTYMVCFLVYFITLGKLGRMVFAWIVVLFLAWFSHTDILPENSFCRSVWLPFLPSDWGHHALGVSGMLSVVLLRKLEGRPNVYFVSGLLLGCVFLMLGSMAHPYWIISKNMCTPTWVAYCLAICFPLMGVLHYVIDIRGKQRWFKWLRPAGEATLTCYTLPYVYYALLGLLDWSYPSCLSSGCWGMARSLCFALLIIWLVGLMQRIRLVLKV